MHPRKKLNIARARRKKRARAKIFGTAEKPRMSIFRSNKWIYAQLIDDDKCATVLSVSTRDIKVNDLSKEKMKSAAFMLGRMIAEKAMAKGIKKAVFDRGAYKYHGRVKEIAEGAREAGLKL